MDMEKIFKLVKESVGERMTDEQIREIIEKPYLEEDEQLEVLVTSDPREFEEKTRKKKDIFEHSWAGRTADVSYTDVLLGDYEPGIDDSYQFSDNGNIENKTNSHKISDFLLNEMQVAFVDNEYSDTYNGNNMFSEEKSLVIYLPDEEKYPEKSSFKEMILKERFEKLSEAIVEQTGDKLTYEQIKGIIEKVDLEDIELPEIVVTSDPFDFDEQARLKKDIFEHSWAGRKVDISYTDVLLGDYQPGIDDRYEYSDNGESQGPRENHQKSDFALDQLQVTLINKDVSDHYNGNEKDELSKKIIIYLPDELQYGKLSRFSELVDKDADEISEDLGEMSRSGLEVDALSNLTEAERNKENKDMDEEER